MSSLIPVPCDLCGADEPIPVLVERGFRICRCARCSLTYVNPRPDRELGEDVGHFEENEWTDAARRTAEEATAVYAEELKSLERFRPGGGHLLDVGCGFGFFLRSAAARGWDIHGIDVSEFAVKHARERLGLENVRRGDLLQAGFPDGHFQAVTMWNLLEHVPWPSKILEEARRVLDAGGVLLVRVPNIDFSRLIWRLRSVLRLAGVRNWWYLMTPPPQHLFGFTPSTLRRLLEKSGLEVIEIVPATAKTGHYARQGWRLGLAAKVAAALTRFVHRASFGRWNVAPTVCAYARKSSA